MFMNRRELLRTIALTAGGATCFSAAATVARALVERRDGAPIVWAAEGANHQNFLALLGHSDPDPAEWIGGRNRLTLYEPWLPHPSGAWRTRLPAAPIVVVESLDPFLEETNSEWRDLLAGARAVVFLGTDACYGGLSWSASEVSRVEELCEATQTPYLKLPGLPVPPHHVAGTLGYLSFAGYPETDRFHRPALFYGQTLCEHCDRRWALEAGEFAPAPGDSGCLLKAGCRGPETHNSCARDRWNGGANWCVGIGAPCTGCSEPGFPDHAGLGLYGQLPGDPLASRARGLSWIRAAGWGFFGLAGAGVAMRMLSGWLHPQNAPRPRLGGGRAPRQEQKQS